MRQYLRLLSKIWTEGDGHADRTGVGTTSLFGYQMRFDLQQGFPLLTTKKIPVKAVFEELFWFLSGSTDVQKLQARGVSIWDEWATTEVCAQFQREAGDLGPIYSHSWRNFGATRVPEETDARYQERWSVARCKWVTPGFKSDGKDQILDLLTKLMSGDRKQAASRRLMLVAYDPSTADEICLPPCHSFAQFKWHEETNKLDLQMYQRSADVFLGVPFNIASYAILLTIFARLCNMIPGEFVHTFGDVHIYNTHRTQVQEQLSRTPRDLPRLYFHPPACDSPGDALRYLARDIKFGDFRLEGYDPLPAIAAPVAV
jgi:thymidylate synthase